MAGDDCVVQIVLVDHHGDPTHLAAQREYWEAHGLTRFFTFGLINRAGALTIDTMNFDGDEHVGPARALLASHTDNPLCQFAFSSMFVGYDGLYYLCCSDWRKQVPLGSVFERSVLDTFGNDCCTSRHILCNGCSLDPVNAIAEELRAVERGDGDGERVSARGDTSRAELRRNRRLARGIGLRAILSRRSVARFRYDLSNTRQILPGRHGGDRREGFRVSLGSVRRRPRDADPVAMPHRSDFLGRSENLPTASAASTPGTGALPLVERPGHLVLVVGTRLRRQDPDEIEAPRMVRGRVPRRRRICTRRSTSPEPLTTP